jgi:nitrogen fixation/metabolism regulation signal transduction histidine kinase
VAPGVATVDVARRSRLIVRLGSAALVLALLTLILSALYIAADAEGVDPRYARFYPYAFVLAAAALLALTAAIAQRLWRLRLQLRRGEPGARTTRRLVLLLLVLALPPVLLVYGFSVRFIGATVDSWLQANSAEALEQALAIGRLYLAERLEAAEREIDRVQQALATVAEADRALAIEEQLDRSSAAQFSLYGADGRLRALAALDPGWLEAQPPAESMLLALRGRGHFGAAEVVDERVQLRLLRRLPGRPGAEPVLQAIYALPAAYGERARAVEAGAAAVRTVEFLRGPLKFSFVLILSFVLLISVLLAILLAFALARRLVAPVSRLAAATRVVAEGRYDAELPEAQDDELGFLVQSFNRMMRELDAAGARARASSEETERQRAFLETVLARLSSGVLVVDAEGRLREANQAASMLLGETMVSRIGTPLSELRRDAPACAPLFDAVAARLREGAREFRAEVVLDRGGDERQLLMLRGARLPDGGVVAVFDDTTAVDRARRDAAWAEVARRLAHEVKNPLTPIQLAAERLRRRVLPRLADDDARVLDRATHTIVAQVEALKTLVNAFGDYARPPLLSRDPVDLNALVGEIIELYAGDAGLRLRTRLAPALAALPADSGRLRQVLHNLLKNAREAVGDGAAVEVEIGTAETSRNGQRMVELWVADDGPGLPPGFDASWFEPYRSTKPKGTGLGLAIVRKIAEEHGGTLATRPSPLGGACFLLQLPG